MKLRNPGSSLLSCLGVRLNEMLMNITANDYKTVHCIDVASDVGVNLCNVKSCLNTSKNAVFTDKRGDLP